MNKRMLRTILSVSVVVCTTGALMLSAQSTSVWTTNGPQGGDVTALTLDPRHPSTLFAGVTGGVFKSTDGGRHWQINSAGLPTSAIVRALRVDPQLSARVYAATSGGVFESTDGGASWPAINNGFSGAPSLAAIAIDPQSPSTIYAAPSSGRVF